MTMTIKEQQRLLKHHGFYHGRIDGISGPKTSVATIGFKESRGLRARDYVGPMTIMALRKAIRPAAANIASDGTRFAMPVWLRLAYSHHGLREIVGRHHNAEILRWWERLSLPFKDDETPWCAGFVNAMVQAAGLPIVGKNRAAALGWRWNGYGTRLDGPAFGAIMSMERPGKPGSGHMTFVAGRDKNGNIMGLGGNQGNMVSINPYSPTARKAQYHWPDGTPPPSVIGLKSLPVITSGGAKLTNEA
jgi:uncharacterized protein (TIGR02594 family)